MSLDIDLMRRSAETPVRAADADFERVARDLTDAFTDDPVFNWFSRPGPGREAARLGLFRFLLKELFGEDGEILTPEGGGAAAVWLPSEALGPNPILKELQAVPVMLRLTGFGRIGRLIKQRECMDHHHKLDRPHAYLSFLGVTRAAQGHGVGSRLLASKTRELDAQGRPAYLETATERNVALYRRHGFEIASEFYPTADGPRQWTMWREPQA